MQARDLLQAEGIGARVVSMPCWELFEQQDAEYRASVLGDSPVRIAIEAGCRHGWDRYIGAEGVFIGMSGFGASAPAPELYQHFGITAEAAAAAAKENALGRVPPIRTLENAMAVRVAINGFGRIGRLVLRAIYESGRTDVEVVAINDLADIKTNAHLLKYDSVHGRFTGTVEAGDGVMTVNGHAIKVVQERDPANLPWGDLDVDVALECTGIFVKRDGASKHLEAGAKKVLISAPGHRRGHHGRLWRQPRQADPDHKIVSNASCTTNCLAPVAMC